MNDHETYTSASPVMDTAKKMHGKWFKTIMAAYMILFIFCVVVLSYDHFKYGAKTPPSKTKKFFRVVEGILLGLISVFVLHMFTIIWKIYKTDKEFGIAGIWYSALCLLLTISSIYWGYYHFAMAPDYNKKTVHSTKEKNEHKIYTVAKWTSIISMVLLMTSLCAGAGGYLESYFCFKMVGELLAAFAN